MRQCFLLTISQIIYHMIFLTRSYVFVYYLIRMVGQILLLMTSLVMQVLLTASLNKPRISFFSPHTLPQKQLLYKEHLVAAFCSIHMIGALPRITRISCWFFGLFCGEVGPIVVWYLAEISSYLVKFTTTAYLMNRERTCRFLRVLCFVFSLVLKFFRNDFSVRLDFQPGVVRLGRTKEFYIRKLTLQMITVQQGVNNHFSQNSLIPEFSFR